MALSIHKVILGDVAKCAPYLPFALKKVRYLHQIKSSQTQTFEIDGVRIRCHVVGEQGFVRLEGGCVHSLEAGALEYGEDSCMNIENVLSCQVYKAGLIKIAASVPPATYLTPKADIPLPRDDPAYPTPKYPPQYTSGVFRLKDPATPLPIKPPPQQSDYLTLNGAPDVCAWRRACYPDQAELIDKKVKLTRYDPLSAYTHNINPSGATGKMRMFLQVVAGSANIFGRLTTYTKPSTGVKTEYLDVHLPVLKENYIVRDALGEYWYFFGYSVWRMLFNKCGDDAKTALKGETGNMTRQRESELEAILFSNVYVDQQTQAFMDSYYANDIMGEKPPPSPPSAVAYTMPTPTGGPLRHAWHFAYQKMTALRVGHVDIGINTATRKQAYLEEITFVTSPDREEYVPPVNGVEQPTKKIPQPPTASLQVLESAPWSEIYFYNWVTHIWRPFSDYMYTPTQHMASEQPSTLACDAPVYAFYDNNDDRITVRYKKTAPGAAVAAPAEPAWAGCGLGVHTMEAEEAGSVTGGFYVVRDGKNAGTMWDGSGKSFTSTDFAEYEHVKEDTELLSAYAFTPMLATVWQTDCAGAQYVGFMGGYVLYGFSAVWHGAMLRLFSRNSPNPQSRSAQSMLMFPMDNPDAVFLGKRVTTDTSYTETEQYGDKFELFANPGSNPRAMVVDRTITSAVWDPVLGNYVDTGIPIWTYTQHYTFADVITPGLWPLSTIKPAITVGKATIDENVVLITQHSLKTLTDTTFETKKYAGGIYQPPVLYEIDPTHISHSPWGSMFLPGRQSGEYPEYRFDARESINGRLWYVKGEGHPPSTVASTSFAVNDPGRTNIYFTGWA